MKATCSGQYILVEVKIMLRTSQDQFGEKLRKLRLRPNDGFLIKKKKCITIYEMREIDLIRE